jgi:hypothetical protein
MLKVFCKMVLADIVRDEDIRQRKHNSLKTIQKSLRLMNNLLKSMWLVCFFDATPLLGDSFRWKGRHYVGSIFESVELNIKCPSTDKQNPPTFPPLCIVYLYFRQQVKEDISVCSGPAKYMSW